MSLRISWQPFKFDDRLKHGLEFEQRVEQVFTELGLQVYPYGLGTLPDSAKLNIVGLNDPTSLLLRFTPDFYCIFPGRLTFFVECKSTKVISPNYSYSLDSYKAGLRLSKLGIKILVVFSGLKAQWIEQLPIAKVYTDRNLLRLTNGSGQPFILIPKAELPSLTTLLRNLAKC